MAIAGRIQTGLSKVVLVTCAWIFGCGCFVGGRVGLRAGRPGLLRG